MPLINFFTKAMIRLLKLLGAVFFLLYPFGIFYALSMGVNVQLLALFLLAFVCAISLKTAQKAVLLVGAGLAGLLFWLQTPVFLMLYPVLMNGMCCLRFLFSLKTTPLVEVFARKMGTPITKEVQIYTRQATLAWTLFLGMNTLISFSTVFMGMDVWIFYNGFLSYLLIGAMMAGEFFIRKRRQHAPLPH